MAQMLRWQAVVAQRRMGTILVGLLLAAGVGGCSLGSAVSRSPAEPPEGEVWLTPEQVGNAHLEIEPVDDRPVGGTVRAAGRVTFDDLRVGHVFSPVTGRISKVLVQLGQQVKKGQGLCVIESPDVGNAASDVAKARATLIAADVERHRQKDLYEQHAAAQRDYELAEGAYATALAEVERAESKARLLHAGPATAGITQEYVLQSPIDGDVIMRGATAGLEIQGQYTGGTNVELFTIGRLDRVWVLADVFEVDLPRVKLGAPVAVHVVAYPNESFNGVVEWISDSLDPSSRTAKARCSIDNPQLELRPEMFGSAVITVDADVKLALRRSALLFLGEQPVVFVQTGATGDGQLRFERRPVAVDEMTSGSYVPLKSGVERSEKVVVNGGVLLLGMM